ncbi:Crp/Fnr family transcriptional regulator [Psychroserpens damuponensis]|uniref:Crp/Fnr family transcriptional regulator n=1 Tax=Psychroserpens damuponensis TaxID=943936 RepID=UPI00058E3DE5|nr:Crp/Fnr family transcriptional regulator [Psychroserpens damuponensis]
MSRCESCIARQLNSMKSMTKAELKRVSDCKTTKFFKKGDVIFDEGESLNGVFCVRDGVAKLTKLSANGNNQTIKLLGKGELLGQRSIISDERTNLSAIALNDIELCYVPKDPIMDPLQVNQVFSFDVLQHLAKDLREAEDDMIDMAQKSVKQRVAQALVYVDKTFGVDDNGYLNLILSRDDYASIVGTATESAIRIISQFKKDKLISTRGKQIKIENLQKLKLIE